MEIVNIEQAVKFALEVKEKIDLVVIIFIKQ